MLPHLIMTMQQVMTLFCINGKRRRKTAGAGGPWQSSHAIHPAATRSMDKRQAQPALYMTNAAVLARRAPAQMTITS